MLYLFMGLMGVFGGARALGLRRINHSVTLPDRPEIRGMLARVPHLVRVEEGS